MERQKEVLWLKVRSRAVLVMGGILLPPILSVFSLPAGPLVATVCLQASGPGPWYLHIGLTGSHATAGPLNYGSVCAWAGSCLFLRVKVTIWKVIDEKTATGSRSSSMLSVNAMHVRMHAFKFLRLPPYIACILSSQPGHRTESNAGRSLTDLQDCSCSLCERLDFWDSRERQMLSAAELRGRASCVSASHTVIPVSSAGPSAACMPVQFQPHAQIRAPQLSGVELTEQGCCSAQNCSVSVCGALHWGGAQDQSPPASQKMDMLRINRHTKTHVHCPWHIQCYSTQWWNMRTHVCSHTQW